MSTLFGAWSGLLRGLTLAGYSAVEISIEADPASATQRLLLDTATQVSYLQGPGPSA